MLLELPPQEYQLMPKQDELAYMPGATAMRDGEAKLHAEHDDAFFIDALHADAEAPAEIAKQAEALSESFMEY